ncbi:MAG: MFS transporter [Coprococcus sp.]|nr:MFS transporter [Coprococcus sp.]
MSMLWMAPSPVLTEITSDLNITLAQSGIFLSVICLIFSASTFVFNGLGRKIKPKYIFGAGLILMAAGQGMFFFTRGYADLLFFRSITGIGMGICAPVYAVLIMENFPKRERPMVNTVYSALPYIAEFLSLFAAAPLLAICGYSWRGMMAAFGGLVVVITGMYVLCLPKISSTVSEEEEKSEKGLFREVARNREVRLLLLADSCDMWGYNFLSGFLPTFFQNEIGMSMKEAAHLTAIFPVAGIAAGLLCGALMVKVGLRKPFTWPMHLMVFAGTMMLSLCDGPLRIVGIVLAGVGNAGWAPALYTMPMEFEGMTPLKTGAAFSFIFGIGYISAFVSPLVGGWLGDCFSLKTVLVVNSFVALLAALATASMKETGKRTEN